MKHYIALFEYELGQPGFSVVFPDIPGLYSAGDTYEETLRMAHEALAFHAQEAQNDSETLPMPRTLEQIADTWPDWQEWTTSCHFLPTYIQLLPLPKKVYRQISLSLDESIIAKVDEVATDRSAFIGRVLEEALV
jgi:predicted RNase H-like HicB family nuclease